MFFRRLKSKQKYLKILTMKSPKMGVKKSHKRPIKALRRNPLRKTNKRNNNNNINIRTVCNETNTQLRSPLRTVYTGYIGKNDDRNGRYNLSISNSRKRRNHSTEIPPSKRRKTIDLCETIVLSDDDDDDEGDHNDNSDHDDRNHHDNINNNDRIYNESPARTRLSHIHETSDIILLSASPKTTRKTTINKKSPLKTRRIINNIQSTEKPATKSDLKDGDEVCVIWSSASKVPAQDEIKLEKIHSHNNQKYFFDTIGDKSNFLKQSLLPIMKVPLVSQKKDEKTSINNNNNNNHTSSSSQTSENKLISRTLREIVVDGLNVTYGYNRKKVFSKKGLQLVLDYFRSRGHDVKIFIPQYERSREREFLEDWYRKGYVIFTPSRRIAGKKIVSYDDRFILDYATKCKGIVVSSDQYRDLWKEKPEWRETIEFRLLPPTFVGDYVMFPEDPLGRSGPRLDEFLRH